MIFNQSKTVVSAAGLLSKPCNFLRLTLGKQHTLRLQTGICSSGAASLPLQQAIFQHVDGGVSITLFKGRRGGGGGSLLLEMDVTEHEEGHRGQAAWEQAIPPLFDLLSFVLG